MAGGGVVERIHGQSLVANAHVGVFDVVYRTSELNVRFDADAIVRAIGVADLIDAADTGMRILFR